MTAVACAIRPRDDGRGAPPLPAGGGGGGGGGDVPTYDHVPFDMLRRLPSRQKPRAHAARALLASRGSSFETHGLPYDNVRAPSPTQQEHHHHHHHHHHQRFGAKKGHDVRTPGQRAAAAAAELVRRGIAPRGTPCTPLTAYLTAPAAAAAAFGHAGRAASGGLAMAPCSRASGAFADKAGLRNAAAPPQETPAPGACDGRAREPTRRATRPADLAGRPPPLTRPTIADSNRRGGPVGASAAVDEPPEASDANEAEGDEEREPADERAVGDNAAGGHARAVRMRSATGSAAHERASAELRALPPSSLAGREHRLAHSGSRASALALPPRRRCSVVPRKVANLGAGFRIAAHADRRRVLGAIQRESRERRLREERRHSALRERDSRPQQ